MNKILAVVVVLAILISVGASAFAHQENREKERLSGVAEQLRVELKESARNRTEFEAEKASLRIQTNGLMVLLSNLDDQFRSSETWLGIRETQIGLAMIRIEELETLLERRGEEVKSLEAEREQLLSGFETAKAEVADLKAVLTSLQRQTADLETRVGIRESQIADLGESLQKRQTKTVSLEAAAASLLSDKQNLENRIKVRESQIAALGQSLQFVSKEWNEETALLAGYLAKLAAGQRSNSKRIVTVYFVPAGMTPRSNGLPSINLAMAEVQAWFYNRLGETFEWDPAVGVMGKHPYAWYYDPNEPYGGVWARAVEEVAVIMPRSAEDTVYLIFFEGWTDPVVAGLGSGEGYRFSFGFVGKPVMEWLAGNPLQRQVALGVVAHEIIHALLRRSAHDPEQESIMNRATAEITRHNIIGEYRRRLEASSFLR